MSLFQYGYAGDRLTADELDMRARWNREHPEFRRRMFWMMVDSGYKIGFGGGWRSIVEQEVLFRSRYTPHAIWLPGRIKWNGLWWSKNKGVASAAPPGRSYHEEMLAGPLKGWALAADMIGDLEWMMENCHRYGLRHFANVNSEPWHIQPVEIPNARASYANQELTDWTLPGQAPVFPPPKEMLMLGIMAITGSPAKFLGWTDARGHFLQVQWIPVHEEYERLKRDEGAREFTFGRHVLKGISLVGPVPPGYQRTEFLAVLGG